MKTISTCTSSLTIQNMLLEEKKNKESLITIIIDQWSKDLTQLLMRLNFKDFNR